MAGSVLSTVHRRFIRSVRRLQVFDVPLRQMEKARRVAHQTRAAVRQLSRNPHGQKIAHPVDTDVLPAFRRQTIFRDVRSAQSPAGDPRPRPDTRHHGQRLRVVPRPERAQNFVQARQTVRPPGEPAGRTVEIGQDQVESHLLRAQTQIDVGRH